MPDNSPAYPAGFVPGDFSNNSLYQLDLPEFSGPLDLLLYLIHREKVDITDIPVAKITSQYLDYLARMEELDIEVASEFLVMAAELLDLKARLLLPKPELEEAEEEIDPRQELARRLTEYQKVKELAAGLEKADMLGRDIFAAGGVADNNVETLNYFRQLDPYSLVTALAAVMQAGHGEPVRLMDLTHLNVRKTMERLLDMLADRQGKNFSALLPPDYRRVEKAVNFLAILELAKIHMVSLNQSGPQGEITVVPLYHDINEALGMLYSTLESNDDDAELLG